ncbi:MAG TPA: transposase [Polyangiaceae bacterium]
MPVRAKKAKLPPLELPFARQRRGRGGSRPGAGRKPGTARPLVRHRSREPLSAAHPLHVVLRSRFRPLRSRFVFPTLRQALAKATRARENFRVIQFSVQNDHLHLIVEAGDKSALSRGMQGLAIRVARAVNRLVSRRGKLWADRFFSRSLGSPRAVKNALGYVLNNFRKHRATGGARIDPYSSAPYFAGFRELRGERPCDLARRLDLPLVPRGVPPPGAATELPVVRARTWLARVGWQRAGLVSFSFRGAR